MTPWNNWKDNLKATAAIVFPVITLLTALFLFIFKTNIEASTDHTSLKDNVVYRIEQHDRTPSHREQRVVNKEILRRLDKVQDGVERLLITHGVEKPHE